MGKSKQSDVFMKQEEYMKQEVEMRQEVELSRNELANDGWVGLRSASNKAQVSPQPVEPGDDEAELAAFNRKHLSNHNYGHGELGESAGKLTPSQDRHAERALKKEAVQI